HVARHPRQRRIPPRLAHRGRRSGRRHLVTGSGRARLRGAPRVDARTARGRRRRTPRRQDAAAVDRLLKTFSESAPKVNPSTIHNVSWVPSEAIRNVHSVSAGKSAGTSLTIGISQAASPTATRYPPQPSSPPVH